MRLNRWQCSDESWAFPASEILADRAVQNLGSAVRIILGRSRPEVRTADPSMKARCLSSPGSGADSFFYQSISRIAG